MEEYRDTTYLTVEDGNIIVKLFTNKVYNNFIEKWNSDLEKYPILRSYKLFKKDFGMERYLLVVRDHKLRRSLSQLRRSSHQLCVETGRHSKLKLVGDQRLCKLCDLKEVESEVHFITF